MFLSQLAPEDRLQGLPTPVDLPHLERIYLRPEEPAGTVPGDLAEQVEVVEVVEVTLDRLIQVLPTHIRVILDIRGAQVLRAAEEAEEVEADAGGIIQIRHRHTPRYPFRLRGPVDRELPQTVDREDMAEDLL